MAQKFSATIIFLLIISFFIFSLPVGFVYADGDSTAESGTENLIASGEGGTTETGGTEVNDQTNTTSLSYMFDSTILIKDIKENDLPASWNKNDLANLAIPLPDIDYTIYDISNTAWLVKVGTKYSDMQKILADEDEDVTFKLPSGFQTSSNSIEFKLQTTEIEYKIIYNRLPSGLSVPPDKSTYKKGETVDFSSAELRPEIYGYVFLGWFEDSTLLTPKKNITADDYGDVYVWASVRINMITIHFSGAEYPNQQVEYGTSARLVINDKTPTRDGYEFVGWFSDKYYTRKIVDSTLIIGEDGAEFTFYAKWEQKAQPWIYYLILTFVGLTVVATVLWWAVFRPKKESFDA